MKVLIVKLSSLGDVVHTLPAVMDIRRNFPNAQIDWVVEPAFAPLVAQCHGVNHVIACNLRLWRKTPFASKTWAAWRAFKKELQLNAYDAIIDAQGLTKSAWIAWMARTTPQGKRFALGNQTEGSSYERPTRWVADIAIPVASHSHAVSRGRLLCSQALGYDIPDDVNYGLSRVVALKNKYVYFAHGTSRASKEWPLNHWIDLGLRFIKAGFEIALPHGNEEEHHRATLLASALPGALVLPRYAIDELMKHMSQSQGVIGVDTGLSHIAVALDLPHVQIYNTDTAWRTGPIHTTHQRSVVDTSIPGVEAVWQAWQDCYTSAAM